MTPNRTCLATLAGALLLALACSSPDPYRRDEGPGPDARVDPGAGDSGRDDTSRRDDGPGPDTRDPGTDGTGPGDPGPGDPAPGDTAGDPGGDGAAADDGGGSDGGGDGGSDGGWVPEVVGDPVVRSCEATLSWRGTATSVAVPGDWNAWSTTAQPLADGDGDGTWTATLDLSDVTPGTHAYKILVDGTKWQLDPANPLTVWDAGFANENSKLVVPDCTLPALELRSASADWATRTVTAEVQALAGLGGEPLRADSLRVLAGGVPVDPGWDPATQRFRVRLAGLARGKHTLTFQAASAAGAARPLTVPVWLEERPFDWRDAVLYFAMVDRFANGDPSNDGGASCVPQAQSCRHTEWVGGDWKGLRQRIEAGWFDDLGINALWISAANDNPDGCSGGDLGGVQYTAYHAYFPLSLDTTENHFGTMEELRAMVDAAHARGIRVVMDLAANHVHEDSDLWATRKEWFNRTPLLCGQDDNWNKHPIDCWFQDYLPDLDYRVDDAVEAVTDSAIDWATRADLDGFRVDAVKHMVHSLGYHLRAKVRERLEASGVPFWLVGETYVGEWGDGAGGNEGTVRAYVSDRELTGQFDFPLYWEVVGILARSEGTMARLVDVAAATHAYWLQGFAGAIMSNFLGNHDVPRFVTHANGQIKDRWGNDSKILCENPPAQPSSPVPYRRLQMAFAFLMTIPGVPLVYYGDEVGLAGGGDPDNRRPMVFEGLSADQLAVKETLGKLAAFRAAHPATRTGTLTTLWSDTDGVAYAAQGGGDAVVTVLNRGAARTVEVTVSGVSGIGAGGLRDGITGATVPVAGGKVSLAMPAQGWVVLTP